MSFTLGSQFRPSLSEVKTVTAPDRPVPDNLDLSAMARSALNYLRGNPDPDRNHECKFALGPLGIPCHVPISPSNKSGFDVVSLGDTDSRMDMQYPHMRAMAGEPEPDSVELGVRRRTESYLKKDHRCWLNPGACLGKTIAGEYVITWTTGKLLYRLSEEFQRTGDRQIKARTRKIFLALKKMALWDGKRAFYWGIAPYKDGQWLLRNWCQSHGRNYPWIVEPLVRYWECTGDAEALDLAKAFTEGFLDEVQPEMGNQRIDPATGAFSGHVHIHTHAVWGVAHLGAVLGEKRYLDWARKVHDFVVSVGTDFGWYPEFSPQGEYRTEICVVGDMVSLGAWLARGGYPHYWDTIERTVRNELRQSQFSLTPAFVDLFEKIHRDKPKPEVKAALKALRAIEGGFVAQATFDDWVSYPLGAPGLNSNGIQMMGCCPPEGMRGLWEIWNGIVEPRPEGVFVNMAITHDHAAAKVQAFRPEDGRVEVTAKSAGTYFLRAPAWSDRDAWSLTRDGHAMPAAWGGPAQAYVVCKNVKRGEKLTLTWPALRFTQVFTPKSIPGRDAPVTVRWLGNQVTDVEPRGQHLPMFSTAR